MKRNGRSAAKYRTKAEIQSDRLDEMLQSERREASIALRFLAGESIDSEPLYFRATDGRKILTYAGALNLAELSAGFRSWLPAALAGAALSAVVCGAAAKERRETAPWLELEIDG